MTTSPPRSAAPSEGTMECRTGAILQGEGARAVGSTFARAWDSEPGAEAPPAVPARGPDSLAALPAPPRPAAPAPSPLAIARVGPAARSAAEAHPPEVPVSVPWSFAGAFALGAAIAALAGLVLERGAVEIAALSSAVAGGMTLSAALARLPNRGHTAIVRRPRERS